MFHQMLWFPFVSLSTSLTVYSDGFIYYDREFRTQTLNFNFILLLFIYYYKLLDFDHEYLFSLNIFLDIFTLISNFKRKTKTLQQIMLLWNSSKKIVYVTTIVHSPQMTILFLKQYMRWKWVNVKCCLSVIDRRAISNFFFLFNQHHTKT